MWDVPAVVHTDLGVGDAGKKNGGDLRVVSKSADNTVLVTDQAEVNQLQNLARAWWYMR